MISKGGKKENEEIAAKIAAKRMGAGREMMVPRALPLTRH